MQHSWTGCFDGLEMTLLYPTLRWINLFSYDISLIVQMLLVTGNRVYYDSWGLHYDPWGYTMRLGVHYDLWGYTVTPGGTHDPWGVTMTPGVHYDPWGYTMTPGVHGLLTLGVVNEVNGREVEDNCLLLLLMLLQQTNLNLSDDGSGLVYTVLVQIF